VCFGASDGVDGWQKRIGCDGSGCGGVTEFIVLSAKPVGCIVLMFIVQVHIRPVTDFAAQR
jgi:hypothetical protein